jgi:hypothetical protein
MHTLSSFASFPMHGVLMLVNRRQQRVCLNSTQSDACVPVVFQAHNPLLLLNSQVVMTGHPFSTASPSSSANSNLPSPPSGSSNSAAIPPSSFYAPPARNRPVTPPSQTSNPTSTPVSKKTSGTHAYASEIHDRESANYRLALETTGLFLGAMPVRRFLNEFLPMSQDAPGCPTSTGAFANVGDKKTEINMYAPFVSTVLVLHWLCLTTNTR